MPSLLFLLLPARRPSAVSSPPLLTTNRSTAWWCLAGLSIAATVWLSAGAPALLYAVVYLAATAPGLVLGRAVFGHHHPAGWVAGALVGYGTTQLALWLAIAAGIPHAWGFLGTWLVQGSVLVFAARAIGTRAVTLPSWTAPDTRALCLTLLLIPILMLPPYRHLGARDAEGTRYYRAYFTADFVWHTALTAELGKHSMPPRNPYLAPMPIHYYWTYFLLPAIVAHDGPAPLRDVQRSLEANAICSATLVVAAMFLFVRTAVPAAWAAATATALGLVAGSAEGAWTLQRILRAGAPLAAVKDLNIDAVTAWQFQGIRIDCLPRSLWYNPQHSTACALGLAALLIAAAAETAAPAAIMFAGLALGLATTLNPFVGGVFALIYGTSVLWQAAGSRAFVTAMRRHARAAVPVVAALGWIAANRITSGGGSSLHFGVHGAAANHPVATILLSTGPVLLPGLAGLWPARRLPPQPWRIAAVGAIAAVALIYLLTLGDADWVGFRAGQILYLMLPVLIARFLWTVRAGTHGRARVAAVIAVIMVAGMPTTIIDEYNAQDIGNRAIGAGFRWTVTLSAADQEALDWVRAHVPEQAIVQVEPIVRGRDEWSFIPSFAERRMAAGLPISLLAAPEYRQRSEEVRRMFLTPDVHEAWMIAAHLHIAYIFTEPTDLEAYGDGARKFATDARYFEPVFSNAEAAVYRVR